MWFVVCGGGYAMLRPMPAMIARVCACVALTLPHTLVRFGGACARECSRRAAFVSVLFARFSLLLRFKHVLAIRTRTYTHEQTRASTGTTDGRALMFASNARRDCANVNYTTICFLLRCGAESVHIRRGLWCAHISLLTVVLCRWSPSDTSRNSAGTRSGIRTPTDAIRYVVFSLFVVRWQSNPESDADMR